MTIPKGLGYLATPYSLYKEGLDEAFVEAARIAGKLFKLGVHAYSPICHCHPIALAGGINPTDHAIWTPFNELLMGFCDYLVVAHMQGWERSFGVEQETQFFLDAKKPIYDLDPKSLTLNKRSEVARRTSEAS